MEPRYFYPPIPPGSGGGPRPSQWTSYRVSPPHHYPYHIPRPGLLGSGPGFNGNFSGVPRFPTRGRGRGGEGGRGRGRGRGVDAAREQSSKKNSKPGKK